MRRCSWIGVLSQQYLKVRPHDFPHPAYARKLHQIAGFKAFLFSVKLKCFDGCVEADLVPILEAIRYRLLGAVNSELNAFYLVRFNSSLECFSSEPKNRTGG